MAEIDENLYDAVVVGAGPAGLTAAIYLARACYRVLVVEKEKIGGQITITSEVVNYPGAEPQSGEELTEKMRKQAESFGAEFMMAEVTGLDLDGDIKTVTTTRGDLKAVSVLLATGAHPRMIGFEGEEEFKGHGVAYCATCDGEFFADKEVFVVGGGFAAAEEAVFLTRYASHVTILVRGDDFSCAKEVADETKANPKITVLTNSEVVKVEGDSVLRKITYKNNKTGEVATFESKDDTFGVFVFAGYSPSTDLIKGIADLDERGYVITDNKFMTSKEGLFAAGDVCIKQLRQVVTATGDGAAAATEIEKYAAKVKVEKGIETIGAVKKAVEEASKKNVSQANGQASDGRILDAGMKQQLAPVFERMTEPLVLELHLDNSNTSHELKQYMEELAELTDKLSVIEVVVDGEEARPFVRVLKGGNPVGITFHGVPGGHEFTSFVLGLYNASGPGQAVADDTRKRIEAINKPLDIKVMVTLSCTKCPDVVVAAERIATLNENVNVEVFELSSNPAMKDKYNVMSVPAYIIGDAQSPAFGKKTIEELLDQIEG